LHQKGIFPVQYSPFSKLNTITTHFLKKIIAYAAEHITLFFVLFVPY
jgi:hypothetical protein